MVYHRQCTINLCNIGERQLEWFWVQDEPGVLNAAIPLPVNTIQSSGGNLTKNNYAHSLPVDGTFGALSFSLFAFNDTISVPDQIGLNIVRYTTIAPESALAVAFGGLSVPGEVLVNGVEIIESVVLDIDSENTQLFQEGANPEVLRSCITAPLPDVVFFSCDNIGVIVSAMDTFGFLTFAQIQVSIASGSRP